MPEKILILGAGAAQTPGIQYAQQMGFTVIVTDADPHAPGLKTADVPVVMDVKDVPGTIALAREHGVSGVVSVSVEAAVRTAAAVCCELGLTGLTPEAAANATNKYRMRKAWSESGVPSPRFCACRSLDEAQIAASEIGFPVVVKPAKNAGSRGVSLVQQPTSMPTSYKHASAHANGGPVPGPSHLIWHSCNAITTISSSCVAGELPGIGPR